MGLFGKRKGRIKEKWQRDVKSDFLAGPMVYDVDKDGRREIVCGTKDGRVIMMDEDSNTRWTYDVKEEVGEVESYFHDPDKANSINGPPAIGDIDDDALNEVVFGTEMGVVYALNNKGEIKWKFEADNAVRASVHLEDVNNDGLLEVIFGCMDGNLYVVSARGELLWKHEAGSPIEGTPTYVGSQERLIFGCHDGTVRCVKLGEEAVWKFKTKDKVIARPVVTDLFNNDHNVIIVGSTDYRLYVLNEEGEEIWNYRTEGAILSEAAVADINGDDRKEIVFGSCDNNVYAVTHDGDTIWTYETYFWVVAPPIVEDIDGDGRLEIIVGSYDHNIYVLDSEGYYSLDYVPGLGGVVHQSGHHSEVMTREPGKVQAKKIWQFKTPGYVVGTAVDDEYKNIIVNVKEGKVEDLVHSDA